MVSPETPDAQRDYDDSDTVSPQRIPVFQVEKKANGSRTSITLLDTEVTCVIDGQFISSDRVTVMSGELPGSAWFDVPDYGE
jgi:hypothetical protein